MAKRNFARLTLVLIAWCGPGHAATNPGMKFASDGCSVLMSAVASAVQEFANPSEIVAKAPPPSDESTSRFATGGRLLSCQSTVSSTTRAFRKAMSDLGIGITWQQAPLVSGDFCWSYELSECYPRIDFDNGSVSGADANFVAAAWISVRKSVGSFTPYGIPGDVITFGDAVLRQSLRAANGEYTVAGAADRRFETR